VKTTGETEAKKENVVERGRTETEMLERARAAKAAKLRKATERAKKTPLQRLQSREGLARLCSPGRA